MNREDKASQVADLKDKFGKATIAFAAEYRGMTVPVFQEVRRELKKNNAEIKVAKNTLLRLAVEGSGFEGLREHFTGTTAVAVSYGDPVGSTKVLTEFVKTHPELVLRGAVLDGKALSLDDLTALSKLPSREVLLSKLLSVMQAVPTNFVQVLSGVPRKLVYLLQAVKDQKEQQG